VARDEDVRWFYVAMDEARLVAGVQRERELREEATRQLGAGLHGRSGDRSVEMPTPHVRHHEEGRRALGVELARRDHVRVREPAQPPVFALQTDERSLVTKDL